MTDPDPYTPLNEPPQLPPGYDAAAEKARFAAMAQAAEQTAALAEVVNPRLLALHRQQKEKTK